MATFTYFSQSWKASAVQSWVGLRPNGPFDEEHQDLEHHDLLLSRVGEE